MTGLQDYCFQSGQGTPPKKMVIFLHGYGADGKDLISIAPLWTDALKDTIFYAPNAPEMCEMSQMGFQWFSLTDRSDEAMSAQIKHAFPILKNYIEKKCDDHNLTVQDVAIVGFSQGTMMALYTLPQMDLPCAEALCYSGRLIGLDHIAKESLQRFPICAIHGDQDEIVPYESLSNMEQRLTDLGYNIQTHTRPGLGHGIDSEGLRIGLDALQKSLSVV